MVIKTPIFAYYKLSIKTIVEKNLFNSIDNRVFFQLDDNKLLYFIAFFLINFNFTKQKYEI